MISYKKIIFTTLLSLINLITLFGQDIKPKADLYNEIKSLIVADSVYRDYLLRQLAKLDSVSTNVHGVSLATHDKGKPVVPFRDTLFYVQGRLGLTAEQRANAIEDSVIEIAENTLYFTDSIVLEPFEETYLLKYKGKIIHIVDTSDALNEKKTVLALSKYRQLRINDSLHDKINYQGKTSGIIALVGLVVIVLLITIINRFYRILLYKVYQKRKTWFKNKSIRNIDILSERNQRGIAKYSLLAIRVGLIFILISLYLPIVGRFSPPLRDFSDQVLGYIINPVVDIVHSMIAYIPNLLKIIIIVFVFHYAMRFINIFAVAIADGRLKINGFFPDWVPPTMKIIKFVLYTFMAIMIFPLLPGAKSTEFQGISVFVGILLSIGSTSVITNAISGIVITYMRRFKIGDWIKIDDVTGEVVERSLFVTRLKTTKNEIITVPYSKISESNTINYSQPINKYRLIIHTSVTVGFDIPWRKVHDLLLEAAHDTDGIINSDKAFVLQTYLDDFYVRYELNAFTRQPSKIPRILSSLHQNMQDIFSRENIELMSPHYRANREDNKITIPDFKLMKDDIEENDPKEEPPKRRGTK